MAKFRFFISYRHAGGSEAARQVAEALVGAGYLPDYDRDIDYGEEITAAVPREISRAHVILPISVGEAESPSAWVNQEIGYAMASNLLIVPVFIVPSDDNASGGRFTMISGVKAIRAPTVAAAAAFVAGADWKKFLSGDTYVGRAVFEYGTSAEGRSEVLIKVAREINLKYGDKDPDIIVRQRSSLTSFSLPIAGEDKNWAALPRYPWLNPVEREALMEVGKTYHLMIDPDFLGDGYEKCVQVAKLKSLRDFLKKSEDGKVQVVVKKFLPTEASTIIGNYWVLQSAAVGPSQETRHALSTWHAPTVDQYCRDFKREFEPLWEKQRDGNTGRAALSGCLKQIEGAIQRYSGAGTRTRR